MKVLFANKFYKIFSADNTFTQPYDLIVCTRLCSILLFCLYMPERHVKPTYFIYLAYTQYTLALAIQILKLLLKLDIVSKPKPQNNHKCPMEATQII